MALLKKKHTLWKGVRYIVNNRSNWEVLDEQEAEYLLNCNIKLKVIPTSKNYFEDKNFVAGTWVYLEKLEEDKEVFKILFPYVPTACLVHGWNYVVEADDVHRTESKESVENYLDTLRKSIPA